MDTLKSIQKEGVISKNQDLLIYDKPYHLWRDGKYLGIGTYTDDINIGDSFLNIGKTSEGDECFEVYCADEWQFA
jgi:hypothetical protein